MPTSGNTPPRTHLRITDLRALLQLLASTIHNSSQIAEGVHQSVWRTLGFRGGSLPGQTGGITGLVYSSVRGITRLVDKSAQLTLPHLETWLAPAMDKEDSPQRLAVLAALNGVIGDKLAAGHSPLATAMHLYYQGQPLDLTGLPSQSSKILLLIHGLCMNERQWCISDAQSGQSASHGADLAKALSYTPIYLRYNTGRHISQNGHELAERLESTLSDWPAPVTELSVVAHSMGGLLIRSAIHYARQAGMAWPEQLQKIVFLGTPHHGAPLERAGNWIDVILGSTAYTAPLAKIGQLRSAGITDLRYGHVLDEDWHGHDRFRRKPDDRQILPLPAGVICYTIAATTASKRGTLTEPILGDGLVPLASALGEHADPQRILQFAPQNQAIAYNTSHMALLSSPEVKRQLLQWLGDNAPLRQTAIPLIN